MTWQEQDLRVVKRSLSRYEKSHIKDRDLLAGNALIFPGEPNTEIEELAHVGFSVDNMFCLEQNADTANELHEYYYDRCRIFLEKSEDFLAKTSKEYSYAHLDYCGQFYRNTANDVCLLSNHLANKCFIRVTVYNARKSTLQKDFEYQILNKLKELLADYQINLADDTDSTNILALFMYIVLAHENIRNLSDFLELDILQLAPVKYLIDKQWIFEYKEPQANNKLCTVFFSLQKLEDCMGTVSFFETIQNLLLTPSYYLKGFEK